MRRRALPYLVLILIAVGGAAWWIFQQRQRVPVLIEFVPPAGAITPLGPPVLSLMPAFFTDDALTLDTTYDVRITLPPAPPGRPPRPLTYLARVLIHESELEQFVARASAELVAVHADPLIRYHGASSAATCATPAAARVDDVNTALGSSALAGHGLDGDGVLVVIVDTEFSIDSIKRHHDDVKFEAHFGWAESGSADGAVSPAATHGTMTAYAATIAAPKATVAEISSSPFSKPRIDGALAGLTELVRQLPRTLAGYRGIVINNSWGVDLEDDFDPAYAAALCVGGSLPKDKIHSTSSPCHVFNTLLKDLDALDVDVVFSAGNSGECAQQRAGANPGIWGPNSLAEVLTVGSVDVTLRRVHDSSQGPGMKGLGEHKPDILAFSEFSKGTLSLKKGEPPAPIFDDPSGTSAAGALTAGVIAALRSKLPRGCFSAADMRDLIRSRAALGVQLADGSPGRLGGITVADPDLGWGALSVTELLAELLPACKAST